MGSSLPKSEDEYATEGLFGRAQIPVANALIAEAGYLTGRFTQARIVWTGL